MSQCVTDVNFQKNPMAKFDCLYHRAAGLNRGVPMDKSTDIMKGSFRRGLHSDVDTFSTRLAVQPRPCTKVTGKKQDGSLLFLQPAFLLYQMVSLLYSAPDLWFIYLPDV